MWHHLIAAVLSLFSFLHSATYPEVVNTAQGSIVRITGMTDNDGERGGYICTGFVYAPDRVLTAAHCIGDLMQADGVAVDEVLKADVGLDLAALRVHSRKHPLAIRMDPVQRFDIITPIGYAFGASQMYADPHRVILVDFSPAPTEMAPGIISEPGCLGGQSGGPQIDSVGAVAAVTQQTSKGTCYGVGSLLMRAFLVGVN